MGIKRKHDVLRNHKSKSSTNHQHAIITTPKQLARSNRT